VSESGKARPEQGQLYRSPASEGVHADSGYSAPGVPAPRLVVGEQYSGQPHQAPESAQDQRGGGAGPAGTPVHPVGSAVVHRTSGQSGTVVGHERNAHTGTAQPRVQWAGEEASWPQGVSANALRVDGSTPVRLYETNQDATSRPPLNRQSGAY
jgi:hypothetical protein